jgi:hypothetical protein
VNVETTILNASKDMKMRTRAFALALGLGLGLTGCSDDFLTTPPLDQLSDGNFWQTGEDLEMAANAVYQDVADMGAWGRDLIYLEGTTDNSYSNKYWMPNFFFGVGSQDAGHWWSASFWREGYESISMANELLEKADKVEGARPELVERVKGEARFLRAYYYLNLTMLFGDVPLLLGVSSIEEARQVKRTPSDDVFKQILEDLTYAASVLPVRYPASGQGRATKGAALALKARAALYAASLSEYAEGDQAEATRLYRTAAEAAKAVMDLGVYSLHPNYRNLFTYAGEGSSEIIFARQQIEKLYGTAIFAALAPLSVGGFSDVVPTRSLTDAFYMVDGLPIDESPLYDPANPYENRDLRLYGSLLYPGAEFMGKTFNSLPDSPTPDALGKNFNATPLGYQQLKYVDPADAANRWSSGLNPIVIRYADVLLMYAEAKAELGEVDGSAIEAFNKVRRRAGMPEVATVTLDMLRHERRVELALEGLRLFDLRRWRIADKVMPGNIYGVDYVKDGAKKTVVADDVRRFQAPRDYLWPIPAKELDLNPSLGQNPGY